jgi:hypothetical protein
MINTLKLTAKRTDMDKGKRRRGEGMIKRSKDQIGKSSQADLVFWEEGVVSVYNG